MNRRRLTLPEQRQLDDRRARWWARALLIAAGIGLAVTLVLGLTGRLR